MNRRSGLAALFLIALLCFSVALVSYVRYANEWLRKPPKLLPCAMLGRQGLLQDEQVTGDSPVVVEDGSTVYLRKAEERAVRCMDRMSQPLSKRLASALAETEPKARARGLVALLRDQVPKDPAADRDAIAVYVFTSAAMRALERAEQRDGKPNEKPDDKPDESESDKPGDKPMTELGALRDELDQLNACRFSMRTVCRKRPPMPIAVYAAGIPSSIVLLLGFGSFGRVLGARLRERYQSWMRARRASAEAKQRAKTNTTGHAKSARKRS